MNKDKKKAAPAENKKAPSDYQSGKTAVNKIEAPAKGKKK